MKGRRHGLPQPKNLGADLHHNLVRPVRSTNTCTISMTTMSVSSSAQLVLRPTLSCIRSPNTLYSTAQPTQPTRRIRTREPRFFPITTTPTAQAQLMGTVCSSLAYRARAHVYTQYTQQ